MHCTEHNRSCCYCYKKTRILVYFGKVWQSMLYCWYEYFSFLVMT